METEIFYEALDEESFSSREGSKESVLSRSLSMLSASSFLSSNSGCNTFCRICHQSEAQTNSQIISPCKCSGTMAHVHRECLERWVTLAAATCCDICGYHYECTKKIPSPFLVTFYFKYSFIQKSYPENNKFY